MPVTPQTYTHPRLIWTVREDGISDWVKNPSAGKTYTITPRPERIAARLYEDWPVPMSRIAVPPLLPQYNITQEDIHRIKLLNRAVQQGYDNPHGAELAFKRLGREHREKFRTSTYYSIRDALALIDRNQGPTLSRLVKELQIIDELYEWRYESDGDQPLYLHVKTPRIKIDGMDMGFFEVRFDLNNSWFSVFPVGENSWCCGYVHPHIEYDSGHLCCGDGEDAIRRAINRGNYSDAVEVIVSILNTYNPDNPYHEMPEFGEWGDDGHDTADYAECYECGDTHPDSTSCPHCWEPHCSNCIRRILPDMRPGRQVYSAYCCEPCGAIWSDYYGSYFNERESPAVWIGEYSSYFPEFRVVEVGDKFYPREEAERCVCGEWLPKDPDLFSQYTHDCPGPEAIDTSEERSPDAEGQESTSVNARPRDSRGRFISTSNTGSGHLGSSNSAVYTTGGTTWYTIPAATYPRYIDQHGRPINPNTPVTVRLNDSSGGGERGRPPADIEF